MKAFMVGILALILSAPAGAEESAQQACVTRAKQQFTAVMEEYIRTAKTTQGTVPANDYLTGAPDPKAFAVCIDWNRSTPSGRVTHGFWYTSGRTSNDPKMVESVALEHCNRIKGNQNCACAIINRNGETAIDFPAAWLRKVCPSR